MGAGAGVAGATGAGEAACATGPAGAAGAAGWLDADPPAGEKAGLAKALFLRPGFFEEEGVVFMCIKLLRTLWFSCSRPAS